MRIHASLLSVRSSQSLLNRRQRLSQARVRSTTQRLGRTSKWRPSGSHFTTAATIRQWSRLSTPVGQRSQSASGGPRSTAPEETGPVRLWQTNTDLAPSRSPCRGTGQALNAGGMNHRCQQQAHGIHHDVAFASGFPLASIVTARPLFPWFSPTGVNDGRAGSNSPPSGPPDQGPEGSVHRFPGAIISPVAEVPPHRTPGTPYPRNSVPQGGRSWDIPPQAYQGMPPRRTYGTPLTISRGSVGDGGQGALHPLWRTAG